MDIDNEQYAGRRPKDSPGQLDLFGDSLGNKVRRNPERQQRFRWVTIRGTRVQIDSKGTIVKGPAALKGLKSRPKTKPAASPDESKPADDWKQKAKDYYAKLGEQQEAERQAKKKNTYDPSDDEQREAADKEINARDAELKAAAEADDAKKKAEDPDQVPAISEDDIGTDPGQYDRMEAGLMSELIARKVAVGMRGIEGREYAIFQHKSGKWQLVSRDPKNDGATKKMTAKEQLDRAKQLGAQAFHDGKGEAANHPELLAMMGSRKIGEVPDGEASSIDIMKAYSDAWTKENLAAPVPEPEAKSDDKPSAADPSKVKINGKEFHVKKEGGQFHYSPDPNAAGWTAASPGSQLEKTIAAQLGDDPKEPAHKPWNERTDEEKQAHRDSITDKVKKSGWQPKLEGKEIRDKDGKLLGHSIDATPPGFGPGNPIDTSDEAKADSVKKSVDAINQALADEKVGKTDDKESKPAAIDKQAAAEQKEQAQAEADRPLDSQPKPTPAEKHSDVTAKGGSPREAAAAATKAADSDYDFARSSAIGNQGEDLKGSARHKVNQWRGLADAEKNGTAAAMVTRANLMKAEPHNLTASIKSETVLSHLAGHLSINAFPPKPDKYPDHYDSMAERSNGKIPPRTPDDKLRKQYHDAYQAIKKVAEETALKTTNPKEVTQAVTREISAQINVLRGQPRDMDNRSHVPPTDLYNPIANQLVTMQKRVNGGSYKKTSVLGNISAFARAYKNKYQDETPTAETLDRMLPHALDVMEGKSVAKSFGIESGSSKKIKPADLYVTHAERTGGRNIPEAADANKATKALVNKYGIRGFQWGNGVTDDERKHHAGRMLEAVTDLAEITGLHPKDIALDGKLGLAVGARGKGNAAAHYEGSTQVINLTRNSGVGVLAHEWGHAFDHMLQDFSNKGGDSNFQSERSHHDDSEIGKAFKKLDAAQTDYRIRLRSALGAAVRAKLISAAKANEYWPTGREVFARSFEKHVYHKMESQGRRNTYLSAQRDKNLTEREATWSALWPTKEESKQMESAFDGIFEAYRKKKHGTTEPVKFSAQDAIDALLPDARHARILEYYAAKKTKSQGQAEFDWISIGEPGSKHPVPIDKKTGKIAGGMGGKFTGKTPGEAFGGSKDNEDLKPNEVEDRRKQTNEEYRKKIRHGIDKAKRNGIVHSDSMKRIQAAQEYLDAGGEPRYRGEDQDHASGLAGIPELEKRVHDTNKITGRKTDWLHEPPSEDDPASNEGIAKRVEAAWNDPYVKKSWLEHSPKELSMIESMNQRPGPEAAFQSAMAAKARKESAKGEKGETPGRNPDDGKPSMTAAMIAADPSGPSERYWNRRGPFMEKTFKGDAWKTSNDLTKQSGPYRDDRSGGPARDLKALVTSGHLQMAWDKTGMPHYANAAAELPEGFITQSDIDANGGKFPGSEDKPGITEATLSNDQAKPGDQMGLIDGEGKRAAAKTGKIQTTGKGKTAGMFGDLNVDPNQMDMFGGDGTPDDLVYKPKDQPAERERKAAESAAKGKADPQVQADIKKWQDNRAKREAAEAPKDQPAGKSGYKFGHIDGGTSKATNDMLNRPESLDERSANLMFDIVPPAEHDDLAKAIGQARPDLAKHAHAFNLERKSDAAANAYNQSGESAAKGAGFTPHLAKQHDSLRKKWDKAEAAYQRAKAAVANQGEAKPKPKAAESSTKEAADKPTNKVKAAKLRDRTASVRQWLNSYKSAASPKERDQEIETVKKSLAELKSSFTSREMERHRDNRLSVIQEAEKAIANHKPASDSYAAGRHARILEYYAYGGADRWITIGADKSQPNGKQGGTPVKITGGGEITAGPDNLEGKNVGQLDKPGGKDQAAPKDPKPEAAAPYGLGEHPQGLTPAAVTAIQTIEAKIDKSKDKEILSAVDANGRTLFEEPGGKDYVNLTDDIQKHCVGAVVTHNHPGGWDYPEDDPRRKGNSFSGADLSVAFGLGVAQMRAISPGYIHTLDMGQSGKQNLKGDALQVLQSQISDYDKQVKNEFWERINKSSDKVQASKVAEAEHWHEVVTRISQARGWKYERTARNEANERSGYAARLRSATSAAERAARHARIVEHYDAKGKDGPTKNGHKIVTGNQGDKGYFVTIGEHPVFVEAKTGKIARGPKSHRGKHVKSIPGTRLRRSKRITSAAKQGDRDSPGQLGAFGDGFGGKFVRGPEKQQGIGLQPAPEPKKIDSPKGSEEPAAKPAPIPIDPNTKYNRNARKPKQRIAQEGENRRKPREKLGSFDSRLADALGYSDPDRIQDIKEAIPDALKMQSTYANEVNDSWRQLLADYGYTGRRASQLTLAARRAAGRGDDYTSIPGFDKMVQTAQASYPEVFKSEAKGANYGGAEADDAAQALFARAVHGFEAVPTRLDPEVLKLAEAMVDQSAGDSEYDDEYDEEFERKAAADWGYEFEPREKKRDPDYVPFAASFASSFIESYQAAIAS